jgi:hypothetical protein
MAETMRRSNATDDLESLEVESAKRFPRTVERPTKTHPEDVGNPEKGIDRGQ